MTAEARSRTMRAVRSRDTTPEMFVRRLLHGAGYRYRLHASELPGCPDIVFRPRAKAIFVNGCFWHGHDCARGARVPKANSTYWKQKIARNRSRDLKNAGLLKAAGWRVLVLWECELGDPRKTLRRLRQFLR